MTDTTNLPPLSPCPFCRSKGLKLLDLWKTFDAGTVAYTHCMKCGANGPSVYSEEGANDAIVKAQAAWNKRSKL